VTTSRPASRSAPDGPGCLMAWGGGGPVFGGGGRAAGLPFGGIPSELQAGVDELLEHEPDHGEPAVRFTQRAQPGEPAGLTLWQLLTRHLRLLLLAAVLVVVTGSVIQAGPRLTQWAIDDGMLPGHGQFSVVVLAAAAYLLSVLVSSLAQRASVRVSGRLAARVMNDLRIRVFTHLQRLSLDFFTDEKAGVLMTRMTSDIENLQQLLQDGLLQLALQALTMVVITALLFTTNVRLAAITLALVLPVLIVLSVWFQRASERGYQRVRDGIAGVLADLSESLSGVRVVTAFNRRWLNTGRHRDVVGHYREANYFVARAQAIYTPGTQLVSYLAQAALLGIGGSMVLNHSLTPGALVAFFLYTNRFLSPIQLLVQQFNTFQQGNASILKLRTLLDTEPSVREAPDAAELPPIEGEIRLEGVGFAYVDGVSVLRDVDLRVAAGETVAVVGPTGAGKSTIAKLIVRFYDPTAGRVTIDGHDLRDVTLASLRRQLGVVPQEAFLFAGSIRDNISFARPDAPEEVVTDAIRRVGLDDLVARLPDGLDSVVQERGQSLSSGERQLVALARAFLAQPRVLVLDEATSNLDLESETRVEAALDALLENRTAVLVAHRISTALKADRVVVVDEGQILEQGPPQELIGAGGLFSEMYATWMRHLDEDSAA
jgi:ATP-binding cassette, subfamily B, bacterial